MDLYSLIASALTYNLNKKILQNGNMKTTTRASKKKLDRYKSFIIYIACLLELLSECWSSHEIV